MALIALQMLEEPGHINPTLKLARSLLARGHRVVYLEPPDLEGYIREQGFEFLPFFEDVYPKGFIRRFQGASRLERLRMRLRNQEGEMRALREGDVARKLERLGPDLLLVDYLNNGVALVARALGIPAVVVSAVYPAEGDGDTPPLSTVLTPGRSRLGRLRVALAWQRLLRERQLGARVVGALNWLGLTWDPRPDWPGFMTELATATGYPHEELAFQTTYPVPTLTGFPEWTLGPEMLDFPRPARPGRLYIESVDEERVEAPGFPWERIDPTKRLIYCSFGTQAFRYRQGPALLRAVMGAVAGNPRWQLVLTTGSHPRAWELGPVPRNAVVVEQAPQLQLLRRAHVAINHGGFGSVKEALLYGVPMLAAPQVYDQPGVSARLVFHGIGRRVGRRDISPVRIRALLEELDASPEIRERVQRLSTRFQEVEHARPGLHAVERLLAGGSHDGKQKPRVWEAGSGEQRSGPGQDEDVDAHALPERGIGVDPVIDVVRSSQLAKALGINVEQPHLASLEAGVGEQLLECVLGEVPAREDGFAVVDQRIEPLPGDRLNSQIAIPLEGLVERLLAGDGVTGGEDELAAFNERLAQPAQEGGDGGRVDVLEHVAAQDDIEPGGGHEVLDRAMGEGDLVREPGHADPGLRPLEPGCIRLDSLDAVEVRRELGDEASLATPCIQQRGLSTSKPAPKPARHLLQDAAIAGFRVALEVLAGALKPLSGELVLAIWVRVVRHQLQKLPQLHEKRSALEGARSE